MSVFELLARTDFFIQKQNNIPKTEINNAQLDSIFSLVLGVAGAVAVIFIVVGGIKYSSSQGDPNSTKQAKEIIIYALVGLVVVMLAFAIIQVATGRVFG